MSTEIYCIHCGRKNLAEAHFCQFCGKLIPGSSEEPEAPKANDNLECAYCGQIITVEKEVTQLLCIQCAAAYEVKWTGGIPSLEILRF